MPEAQLMGGSPQTGLALLLTEFGITVTDGSVWVAIGIALVLGGACLVFGTWTARIVGLLPPDAPSGETLGVGLASGLIVLSTWWAAIWSGGRSSFTPVAAAFAMAIVFTLVERRRRTVDADLPPVTPVRAPGVAADAPSGSSQRLVKVDLATALFVVAVALLYGSTEAPSPRGGVQPIEFSDVVFYAVLGRDLAATGTETNILPSGFTELPGIPGQTWYHWAELWLASAVITISGVSAMAARYFVVLPLVLLAAAALSGTLVRRFVHTRSRGAFALGFLACLFLAPVPFPGTFFSSWAAGFAFGVTLYGLGAVAILLALYAISIIDRLRPSWSLVTFVSAVGAFVLPAHLVLAVLAVVGLGSVWITRTVRDVVVERRLPGVPALWESISGGCALLVFATGIWGLTTGHGLGSTEALKTVAPFNLDWQLSIVCTYLGAGILLTILFGPLLDRREATGLARISLGVIAILVFGAFVWGARLDDFNMYHAFFGGLAVFAVPVAAVAAWALYTRQQARGRTRLVVVLVVVLAAQVAVSVANTTVRLQEFGPRAHNRPIAESLLGAIRDLPTDAKLAYACRPFEEFSFVDSSLLSIDAHTGRRVVPMCFQADVFSSLNGAEISSTVAAAGFSIAPQSALYPNADARPSAAEITTFLHKHDIGYLYVDAEHPNMLVPDATVLASSANGAILRVP